MSYPPPSLGHVLERRRILESPVARVVAVRCRGSTPAWSPDEQVTRAAVVLVRRGVFLRRVDGRAGLADTTTGYLQRPGECQQVAHPAGGDLCTSIGVSDELAERLASGGPLVVPPAADVAHRRLLAAPPHDRSDLVAELMDALLPPDPVRRPASDTIDDVRALLHIEPGRDLPSLAAAVGWSPWYLSRVFRRVTGITLSAYRRRLRVRAALDELAAPADAVPAVALIDAAASPTLTDAAPSGALADTAPAVAPTTAALTRAAPSAALADVAARAGFADQAHMTRAVRAETGLPPAALRRSIIGRIPPLP
jgi:AraC-like DNA-binding protein